MSVASWRAVLLNVPLKVKGEAKKPQESSIYWGLSGSHATKPFYVSSWVFVLTGCRRLRFGCPWPLLFARSASALGWR